MVMGSHGVMVLCKNLTSLPPLGWFFTQNFVKLTVSETYHICVHGYYRLSSNTFNLLKIIQNEKVQSKQVKKKQLSPKTKQMTAKPKKLV